MILYQINENTYSIFEKENQEDDVDKKDDIFIVFVDITFM